MRAPFVGSALATGRVDQVVQEIAGARRRHSAVELAVFCCGLRSGRPPLPGLKHDGS